MRSINKVFVFLICFFIGTFVVSASENLLETNTKNKVMFIKDNQGEFNYSWSFDKEKYQQRKFDFELGISFKSPNEKEINNLINADIKRKYVSFDYHGMLPAEAEIKVPVDDKFKDGTKLNLYYYNPVSNKIELIDKNVNVVNGKATFKIEHCSDYFLTMSIVKNAAGESNNNGTVIIVMLVVIVLLVGYTIMKNKK